MALTQLQKEFDVVGQYRAVLDLRRYKSSIDAFLALEAVLKNSEYHFEVRVAAARCVLVHVCSGGWVVAHV